MSRIKKFALLLCVFSTVCTMAQEKIETDRPDQTESPFTVPKKYFQFEFGLNIEKDKNPTGSYTNFVHPTGLLKYGLNQNVEFRLEFKTFTSRHKVNGLKEYSTSLEPVEVGFKAKLTEENGLLPKTSFILHTALPFAATKEYNHLALAPNYRFSMQNTISKKWTLGYNLGMEWDGESTQPTYTYTIAPGFEINDKWSGYFELFGFISKESLPQHSLDGGLYFYPSRDVKLDLSAGIGLTKEAADFYVALGYSIRFK